jgi:hypothetical protein
VGVGRGLSHPTPWCFLPAPLHGSPGCATRQISESASSSCGPMRRTARLRRRSTQAPCSVGATGGMPNRRLPVSMCATRRRAGPVPGHPAPSNLPAGSCRTLPHGARLQLRSMGAPGCATRQISESASSSCSPSGRARRLRRHLPQAPCSIGATGRMPSRRLPFGQALEIARWELGGACHESPCALGAPCRVLSHPTPWSRRRRVLSRVTPRSQLSLRAAGAPTRATRRTPITRACESPGVIQKGRVFRPDPWF